MKKIGIVLGILGFVTLAFGAAQTRFQNDVVMIQNATVGGTLGVTGNTSLSTVSTSGLVSPNSLAVSGNASVGGTLGVTGNSSLSTVSSSGAATLNSLGVTGNATVGGTLGVTGNSSFTTFSSSGLGSPSSLAVTNGATVGGTLGVSGSSSLSTLNTSGLATLNSASITNTGTLGTLSVLNTGTLNTLITTQSATIGTTLDVGTTTALVGSTKIGGTGSAAASSLLDVVSTTKGFLPPRMTTTQRDAISSPADGLTIFNTTLHAPNYYDSNATTWKSLSPVSGTANYVAIFDGSGNLSSEAQLSQTRGGTGINNAGTLTYGSNNLTFSTSGTTSLTLPTSGTVLTTNSTAIVSNKSIDAATNTITNISNTEIKSGAAIARNKLASGTADYVLINSGAGVLSEEQFLAQVRGGTGVSNGGTLSYGNDNVTFVTSGTTSLTLPTSGTVTTNAGSVSLSNKGIDATSNTITNISNTEIKSGAAIARNKLASGSNNHVIINDGSGVLSSEASLATTRGGTGLTSFTTGDILYASATNVLSKLPIGSSNQGFLVSGGLPAWSNQNLIQAWAGYTITSSGWASAGTYSAKYKRVGDSGVFSGSIRLTTAPTGTFQFSQADFFGNLSLTIDSSKQPGQTDTQIKIGGWEGYKNGAANYGANIYVDTASSQILFQNGSSGTVNATSPTTWGNTDSITWTTDLIPITQWN